MDYYARARSIAYTLEQEGFGSEAENVITAISYGTSGTELLMALRWHLRRVASSQSAIEPCTVAQINELCADLDMVLR